MATRRHFVNFSTHILLTLGLGAALNGASLVGHAQQPPVGLLSVSYAPIRESYVDDSAAYLHDLYFNAGQYIAGRCCRRPSSEKAKAKYASQLPTPALFTIDQGFAGWTNADKDYFAGGRLFDQI